MISFAGLTLCYSSFVNAPKAKKIELSNSNWVSVGDPCEQPGRLLAYGAERYAMLAVIALVLVAIVVMVVLFVNHSSFPQHTIVD